MIVTVVGGGFAGVEAAWGLAERGIRVRLLEMRPVRRTPAHTTDHLAELVCSNSLKSALPTSPAGLLKEEMAALGSVVLQVAHETRVPGGEALCVDRDLFGARLSERIGGHPLIELDRREVTPDDVAAFLDEGPVILATGPLTTPELSEWIARATGRTHLYFYDAVSPVVEASSLNHDVVFAQSRYGKTLEDGSGGDDYLNCPFDKPSYEAFVHELVNAERAPIHAFEAGGVRGEADVSGFELPSKREEAFLEQIKYFAGCTPIEAIAEKGARSLAFGNFKPVGLTDPRTGRRPWAAIQLRPENAEKTLYSLVACQNRLRFGEQRRVFRMVPGLERAEFVRYGVIHRNTYVDAPRVLEADLTMRAVPGLLIAGQLTGVEGYVESAAMGIYAALSAVALVRGERMAAPPRPSAFGALVAHLTDPTPREFAPMNVNWGLLPEPADLRNPRDKEEKRAKKLAAAREAFGEWKEGLGALNFSTA